MLPNVNNRDVYDHQNFIRPSLSYSPTQHNVSVVLVSVYLYYFSLPVVNFIVAKIFYLAYESNVFIKFSNSKSNQEVDDNNGRPVDNMCNCNRNNNKNNKDYLNSNLRYLLAYSNVSDGY